MRFRELEFKRQDVESYDYVLAPFSRTLGSEQQWACEQRWPREHWQRLVDSMPGCSFCVIGHNRDPRGYLSGSNLTEKYGEPFPRVASLLLQVRKGLVSVVSGPSHFAFHLSVTNYLLSRQHGAWGNYPDAIRIPDFCPTTDPERVREILLR